MYKRQSYLSPINGCSGKCIDGVPESGVTRNCLIAKGYAPTIDGLRAAIEEGAAHVHERADGVVILTNKEKGLKIWSETQTDVPMSFEVNPALPRFFFATQKRKDGKHFLVDAFCTDGGGIPRNVIISSGFSLVKLGALSLQEFVFKSSYSATRLYGLKNKGHFSPGADADITIIDFERQKPIHSFVEGKEVLVDGCVKGQGGKFITTQEGLSACKEYEIEPYLIDIKDIFSYRTERFAKNQ
uniref:amidohydrolase family protein n=1 Tax=Parasutterella excrementihominis TaxID=487175 RepID=UPI003FEDD255